MIKYAIKVKFGGDLKGFKGFEHRYIHKRLEGFSIDNFKYKEEKFEKLVPGLQHEKDEYILITKKSTSYEDKKSHIFYKLAVIEALLLAFFAFLSYLLAKNALAPLRKNIERLDCFAKDLIHDLNTPVTSIGLNLKILSKDPLLREHRALERLKKSANDISDLHTNLSFLLTEKSYEFEDIDLKALIETLVQDYKALYPELNFVTLKTEAIVRTNTLAIKQVLDNLLSNACKYSKDSGVISFVFSGKRLEILDNGIGIKNPERIFERNYTEHTHGSGIGLDIVNRLCEMMNIEISVESSSKGTLIILNF